MKPYAKLHEDLLVTVRERLERVVDCPHEHHLDMFEEIGRRARSGQRANEDAEWVKGIVGTAAVFSADRNDHNAASAQLLLRLSMIGSLKRAHFETLLDIAAIALHSAAHLVAPRTPEEPK